ncbi:12550_t:CDS:10 [Ambispora gerdemannii]|uniref:non-specific serine/threonine protein kinase n=1 Tax=Ambispora gerdemannii TaxID=144530 RepID=A0A9N8YTH7_9GLOM|nr:12550_t:CDS:10 [Ambispora gerdemannii]
MSSANRSNSKRQPINGISISIHRENGIRRDQQTTPTTPTTPTRPQRPPLTPTISSPARKKGVKDFEFGRLLGEGSYSTVVAARDRVTQREYAIKILDKKHIIKEKKVKYVNIEKNTLNKMTHPGIVRLYYTFQDKDSLYFVLDHAKNGELLNFIKKLSSFDLRCTQFYAAQILSAIEYMHNQGVIHRDLKPENLLLDEKMHIKVTDFGTAKILEQNSDGKEDDRANSFVGTAEYVSPELLKEKAACKSSDFWALGCIVYQLIAGRPPFKGPNEYITFQKIVGLEYTFPEGFPAVARDLVEKLLVIDPSKRLGAGGQAGVDRLKNHKFFDDIKWDTLWQQPAPKLLPYLPSNPNHNKEELRTPSAMYLQKLSTNHSGDTTSSPVSTGLKQRDPFRLESWASEMDGATEKMDPIKAQKLEEQKRTSSQCCCSTFLFWLHDSHRHEKPLSPSSPINTILSRIPFLSKTELILRAGPINKRKGLFTKRRLLILTDLPRLIYFEQEKQEKMSQKGEIYWSSRMVVELKNKKNFFIHTPQKTYYFEDPTATAHEWVNKINELLVENYGNMF